MRTLRAKLGIAGVLLILIPALIIGLFGYQAYEKENDQAGQALLKNQVHAFVEMIGMLNDRVKSGELTLAEAQEMARERMLGPLEGGKRPTNRERYDLGENGYAFAIDMKEQVMAHPALEGKNMSDVLSPDGLPISKALIEAATKGDGIVRYEWPLPEDPDSFGEKVTYAQVDPNWNWVICAGSYVRDYNSGAASILSLALYTLGALFLMAVLGIWGIQRTVTRPIRRIASGMREVAAGNLAVEPLLVKNRDEIGQLVESYNTMVGDLRGIVSQVRDASANVSASAEELTASAEQTSQASAHIASTVQEIASGTEQQVSRVQASQSVLDTINETITRISERTSAVSAKALETSEISAEGNEVISSAVEQMNALGGTMGNLSSTVRELGDHSQHIGEIVEAITSIAGQTNLLALNAAIEASRAGEHGRGFAVVADEVRKLAEQSSDAARRIGDYIGVIQKEISRTVTSMDHGTQEVAIGIERVSKAGWSFAEIQRSVEEVAEQIHEVTKASNQISSSTSLTEAVQDLAEMAKANASGTQYVSAATEEQLATVEEINTASSSLAKMAEELQMLVTKFKL